MKERLDRLLKVATGKDKEMLQFILKNLDKLSQKQLQQTQKSVEYFEGKYKIELDKL